MNKQDALQFLESDDTMNFLDEILRESYPVENNDQLNLSGFLDRDGSHIVLECIMSKLDQKTLNTALRVNSEFDLIGRHVTRNGKIPIEIPYIQFLYEKGEMTAVRNDPINNSEWYKGVKVLDCNVDIIEVPHETVAKFKSTLRERFTKWHVEKMTITVTNTVEPQLVKTFVEHFSGEQLNNILLCCERETFDVEELTFQYNSSQRNFSPPKDSIVNGLNGRDDKYVGYIMHSSGGKEMYIRVGSSDVSFSTKG